MTDGGFNPYWPLTLSLSLMSDNDAFKRTAVRASCRWARSGLWYHGSLVATVSTPQRSANSRMRLLRVVSP